jgi:hypothetical protein
VKQTVSKELALRKKKLNLEILSKENELLKNKNILVETSCKQIDLDNKDRLDTIKDINEDMVKRNVEENKKREDIQERCDEFRKQVYNKFHNGDVPDNQKIMEDNDNLKKKLQEYKDNMENIKKSLDEQLSLKDKQSDDFQSDFKKQIQEKLDEMKDQSDKLGGENKTLKEDVVFYQCKIDDITKQITSFTGSFESSKKEFEKVSQWF